MALKYLIVGSGYRSEYYGRIAKAWPKLFNARYLVRSQEKAALIKAHTGCEACTDLKSALAFGPDFAVVAVDRGHNAQVISQFVSLGLPVAAETPLGCDMESLKALWNLHEKGKKIVSLEQYPRHPVLAEGLSAVARGVIGTPQTAYLSLMHDYHAASLLRHMLLTGHEEYSMRGVRTSFAAAETDSRYGAIRDGKYALRERDMAHITYESGKTAVYDFSPVQYRSFIRSRHLSVRGSRGEWSDTVILHLDEDGLPARTFLMAELPKKYQSLDSQALRDLRKTRSEELFLDTCHDEYAIATMLLDMGDWLNGGEPPCPLWESLDDAVFWLCMEETVRRPWEEIISPKTPWSDPG